MFYEISYLKYITYFRQTIFFLYHWYSNLRREKYHLYYSRKMCVFVDITHLNFPFVLYVCIGRSTSMNKKKKYYFVYPHSNAAIGPRYDYSDRWLIDAFHYMLVKYTVWRRNFDNLPVVVWKHISGRHSKYRSVMSGSTYVWQNVQSLNHLQQ